MVGGAFVRRCSAAAARRAALLLLLLPAGCCGWILRPFAARQAALLHKKEKVFEKSAWTQ